MTIKELNDQIEREYEINNINLVNVGWFPLMKYDERYGVSKSFEDIRFLSIGLNPSLTDRFAKHIHHKILGLNSNCDFKTEVKFGEERYNAYQANKEHIGLKLVEYQAKLKYDPIEQIPYFEHLTSFFKEIDEKSSFKDHVFHYDFCQLRLTDSQKINPIVSIHYKLLSDHLRDIINLVNPEVIIVFNAWLAKLLRENDFFSAKEIDKNSGCYFLKGKSNTTPKIILANQLSGGATSTVYRELMVWNVQRILNF